MCKNRKINVVGPHYEYTRAKGFLNLVGTERAPSFKERRREEWEAF